MRSVEKQRHKLLEQIVQWSLKFTKKPITPCVSPLIEEMSLHSTLSRNLPPPPPPSHHPQMIDRVTFEAAPNERDIGSLHLTIFVQSATTTSSSASCLTTTTTTTAILPGHKTLFHFIITIVPFYLSPYLPPKSLCRMTRKW